MTNVAAVIVAAFVHMVLRMTIFLEPNYGARTPQTPISSWLFLLSVLEMLWDTDFISVRYRVLPPWYLWGVELMACIFLVEFAIIVVWGNLEKLLYRSLKITFAILAPTLDTVQGALLIELATIVMSAFIFYYASYGTDTVFRLKATYRMLLRNIGRKGSIVLNRVSYNNTAVTKLNACCADMEDGFKLEGHTKVRRSHRSSSKHSRGSGKNSSI